MFASPMRALLASALLLLASSAGAQDADDVGALETRSAERAAASAELEAQAEALAAERARLQTDLVSAANAQGLAERRALAAEAQLETLGSEKSALEAAVAADAVALEDALAALQRIERAAPPAIIAAPGDAADAARAASLLAVLAPALQERVATAQARIAELQALEARIAGQRSSLTSAEDALETRRGAVETLIAEKAALEEQLRSDAAAEAEAAQALARRAQTLRELIAELRARAAARPPAEEPAPEIARPPIPRLKPAPPAPGLALQPFSPMTRRFADARGALAAPAAGEIEEASGSGAGRDGLVIHTRRRAQVTSPFDARIEFAGAFLGYGQLLILSVGDGYHIVLAGLSAVYGVSGQMVLAGEPLGEMSDRRRPPPELYVEFRKDGEPIDPAPWLRR